MATISTPFRYKHSFLNTDGIVSPVTDGSTRTPAGLKDLLCTYLEIAPCVFLVASAQCRGRQCVLELVYLPFDGATRTGKSAETSLEEQARASAAALPPTLRAAFRIPKVLQLETDDEGFITTLELLPDCVRGGSLPVPKTDLQPKEAVSPLSNRRERGEAASGAVDLSALHVHLFIGTSNGTVLVGNALRGTLLAVAQFQYHHDMLRRRHVGVEGEGSPTTVTGPTGDVNARPGQSTNTEADGKTNQSVVRFAAHVRSPDTAWNPSLLSAGFGTSSSAAPTDATTTVPSPTSFPALATAASSKSPTAVPECVYVVHSGGKIVCLDRRALDVFVRVSTSRLDGKRPHLSLEWVTSTISTAFPVAGPAIDFASFVQWVYTAPPPSHYTDGEKRTFGADAGDDVLFNAAHFPGRQIHDAAFFAAPCGASSLTAPLAEHTVDVAGVILCGRFPAFAAYLLEQQRDEFSASKAMKAVASAVSGMAKNLWRSALGTPTQPAPLPRLAKRPQRVEAGLLAADTTVTSVLIDPTNQWAAMGYEGGGRIYLVELATGSICRILKGCRAAQFHWTSVTLLGKRVSALVVHLPLRKLVEVHTVRLRGRIAACHVDSSAVLLRPSACRLYASSSSSVGAAVSTGHALLMSPSGDIQQLSIDLTGLEQEIRTQQQREQVGNSGTTAARDNFTGPASLIAACRTPDDFFDLGLQIPLPQGPFFSPSTQDATADTNDSHGGGGGDGRERPRSRYEEAAAFKFRAYKRQMGEVCDAVKRRFAPAYSEPRVIPLPQTSRVVVVDGPAVVQALRKPLTAAQCLNYLQLRARLVDCYGRLLASHRVAPAGDGIDELERQWGGVVPAPLWSTTVVDAQNKVAQKFWVGAVQNWAAAPPHATLDWSSLKKLVTNAARHVDATQFSLSSTTSAGDADDEQVAPREFLSYFFCGDEKPVFLFSHKPHALANTSTARQNELTCYDGIGRLLLAGGGTIQAFLARLPDVMTLGLDISDLACITLTWIYRTCCRSLVSFLASNNLGALCFVLQLFPDDGFVTAIAQIPLLLGSAAASPTASVRNGSTADGIVGLVLCILARANVKQTSMTDSAALRMRQLVQQLLGLHDCVQAHAFDDAALSDFSVAVEDLLPGGADTLESLCARRGAAAEQVTALSKQLPRAAAEKGALAIDYLLLERTLNLFLGDCTADTTTASTTRAGLHDAWPWVTGQKWDSNAFTRAVIDPLRGQWRESEPAGTTTRRPESERWALFSQCCVLAYTLTVVDRLVQPLGDPSLTFWDFNSIPDTNFLERVQTNKRDNSGTTTTGDRRWLVGDDATREYLSCVRDVTLFAQSCARSVFGRHAEATRVVTVIQTIAACLAADDELAFPLAPRTLRRGLRFIMQLSGFNSELLPYRLGELLSLLQLLIFWVQVDTLGADEATLPAIRRLSVPWRDLFGAHDSFFLFFPAAALPCPDTSDAQTPEADLDARFAASLPTRRAFLSTAAATASSILVRKFLLAFDPTAAAATTPGAGSTDDTWLDSHVLASAVDRLSAALGLQDIVPGFSRLALLDATIKRLRSPEKMASILLIIPDRGLAARVAMRDLGAILACVLKYFSQQRKKLAEKQQREAFDQASLRMNGVLTLMSQPCRHWLKSLQPGSTETRLGSTSAPDALPDNGSTMSLERASVGGATNWFTEGEMDALFLRVGRTIQLPDDEHTKKNFIELLFRLAQLCVEGKSRLGREERRVVDELPAVAEGIAPFLK